MVAICNMAEILWSCSQRDRSILWTCTLLYVNQKCLLPSVGFNGNISNDRHFQDKSQKYENQLTYKQIDVQLCSIRDGSIAFGGRKLYYMHNQN